jgi:phosphatidylinositol alpha-1,6-mannosyltransferase
VLRGARLLIANSRSTERMLRDLWSVPADQVRVLNPGVDVGRFMPAAADPDVRARLGWRDRSVILTVGRLQKRKGHDRMISAMREILKTHPSALYAIVGDGEELPFLRKLVDEHGLAGNVQFLGELCDEDLIRCYQQCDLFVLPNRQVGKDVEGFGMVLLEAQACAKPVVAGDSGGTRETMRIPESGRIVDCDDVTALAGCVSDLLDDPAQLEHMGQAGRQLVVERFDWEALCRQATRLFAHPTPEAECRPGMEAVRS